MSGREEEGRLHRREMSEEGSDGKRWEREILGSDKKEEEHENENERKTGNNER